jgi:hypothetical protein
MHDYSYPTFRTLAPSSLVKPPVMRSEAGPMLDKVLA